MKKNISRDGFAVIEDVYTNAEIELLLEKIEKADPTSPTFRKSADLFAVRQFLKELPETIPVLFNDKLKELVRNMSGDNYFVVKSIYFDKPGESNWFVSYHQDLTISVNNKIDINGYGPWTIKHNQFAVHPPIELLEKNFTIRIHLDDTNELNGALKVIPGSHLKKIYRAETIDWQKEKETYCCIKKGAVMIMKPLLLHASNRTINNAKRRVIHIEFSNIELPGQLEWSERLDILN